MIAWLFENSIAFVLVFFWGYFVAKCLRGGFFAVILGLFLGLMYYDVIASKKSFILDIVFIIGVLHCWYDLKSKFTEYASYGWYTGIENLRYKFSSVIERMQLKSIQQDESHQAYDSGFHDQINEELHKERSKREQAEKREQRYKEEARRAREEANNQHNQKPPPSQDELDPTNLKDAYEILGVPYGTDKAECKKAFRKLMAMYHPDKLAGFSGWRKEQMEKEAKLIGAAWEAITKLGK